MWLEYSVPHIEEIGRRHRVQGGVSSSIQADGQSTCQDEPPEVF